MSMRCIKCSCAAHNCSCLSTCCQPSITTSQDYLFSTESSGSSKVFSERQLAIAVYRVARVEVTEWQKKYSIRSSVAEDTALYRRLLVYRVGPRNRFFISCQVLDESELREIKYSKERLADRASVAREVAQIPQLCLILFYLQVRLNPEKDEEDREHQNTKEW